MKTQFLSCVAVNFKFYWRNRLLLAMALFMIFILAMSVIPSMILTTKSDQFTILTQILESLRTFVYLLCGGIALVTISHHLRNRIIKMVITKYCPMEIWLLSQFASSIVITVGFSIVICLIGAVLFWICKIPFQWGIFFVVAVTLLRAIILFAYLVLLTSFFHPTVAMLVALLLQDRIFKNLLEWITAGLRESHSVWLSLANVVTRALYYILPSYDPYSEKIQHVESSLRFGSEDLRYLGIIAAYTFFISCFCFLASNYFLKRKSHV